MSIRTYTIVLVSIIMVVLAGAISLELAKILVASDITDAVKHHWQRLKFILLLTLVLLVAMGVALYYGFERLLNRITGLQQELKEQNLFLEGKIRNRTARLKEEIEQRKQIDSRYKDLVENSSDWIWEMDENFIITYSNPKSNEVIGYSPGEMVTTQPYRYLAVTEKERVQNFFAERAVDHAPFNRFACSTLHKDGHEIIIETNAVPVLAEKGSLLGYRCVTRDITKHMQARDQEQLFLEVFKQSEDAILILKDEQFIDCNQAAVKMLRVLDKETVINTHPAEFSPTHQPDGSLSQEKAGKMIEMALAKSFHRFEWLHCCLNGEDLPCEVTLTKTVLAGETVLHAILHDLSKQKEREHHLQIFQAAMEQSLDGIAMADLEGQIQFVNSAWTKMHGYGTENLVGRYLSAFHTEEQLKQDVEPFNEYVRHSGSYSGEVGHVTKDGRRFPTRMSVTLIHGSGGSPVGLVAIAHDITQQKKTEALRKDKEAAELANQAKSEFLANMSHELRTPMHGILSYARFGIHRIDKVDLTKLLEYFQEIAASGEQLMLLLNDLLDLAKLEAGKMSYVMGVHEVAPKIEQVLTEFAAAADERGISMLFDNRDESLTAWFDTDRIGQVLRNLLSNAIKFTEPGKQISIDTVKDTIQLDGKIQEAVRISVIDQGVGVPLGELETIFDKFIQSSKTKTGAGGTGLGLPICKQIVDDHRGARIWAEINPGGGMIFNLVLPSKS